MTNVTAIVSPEAEHDAADHADPGIRNNDASDDFPLVASDAVGGFLQDGRHSVENVARDRSDKGQHHDRQHKPCRKHTDSVRRAREDGREDRERREQCDDRRLDVLLDEGRKHEQAPDPVDDRRNARQEFDGNADWATKALGAQLSQKDRDP
jgi:hypothetical protein